MTEQEFLDKIKVTVYFKEEKGYKYRPTKGKLSDKLITDFIYKEWCSGGIGGGSCWGDGGHYATDGEPEPEFVELDTILTEMCPNMTFLQYKALIKDLKIEAGSWSRYEYYGNSTNYSFKVICLKDLYNELSCKKLLS